MHGRPVGVIPFAAQQLRIAANAAAKRFGVTTGLRSQKPAGCADNALAAGRTCTSVSTADRGCCSVLPIRRLDECAAAGGAGPPGEDQEPGAGGRRGAHHLLHRLRAGGSPRSPRAWKAGQSDGAASRRPAGSSAPPRARGDARGRQAHTRTFEAERDSHDRGHLEHQPRTAEFALGQRDRRALLVRAPRLRRRTAGDETRLDRPRPGPAPGGAQRRGPPGRWPGNWW